MYNQLIHEMTKPIFIVFTLDFIIFIILGSFLFRKDNNTFLKKASKEAKDFKEESKERENKNFRYLHANLLRLEERVNSLENKPKRKYIRKEKKEVVNE